MEKRIQMLSSSNSGIIETLTYLPIKIRKSVYNQKKVKLITPNKTIVLSIINPI